MSSSVGGREVAPGYEDTIPKAVDSRAGASERPSAANAAATLKQVRRGSQLQSCLVYQALCSVFRLLVPSGTTYTDFEGRGDIAVKRSEAVSCSEKPRASSTNAALASIVC